jgi:iron complex transport system ATP-binding protein
MTGPALELRDVQWICRGRVLLADINLTLEAGTSCAILGPNGAGKSALLALISGYLWPTRGRVTLQGESLGAVPVGQVRRGLGLVEPSRCPAFPARLNTREVVATGIFGTLMLPLGTPVSRTQWQTVEQELERFGISALARRRFTTLSSGEKMKALLARALVGEATILLLDEPTVGLDMGMRARCVALLDRLMERPDPPTLVVVSHHLDELPTRLDHLILLKGGRIVQQGPPEAVLTGEHLSRLFDCTVSVARRHGRYLASLR